jgi:Predicted Zn peptidase
MINRSRLLFARKYRRYTIGTLAKKSTVSVRTISDYENGKDVDPRPENIAKLAKALEVPAEFFWLDDPETLMSEQVYFRAASRMSALDRDQNLCYGQMAMEITRWIDENFNLPAVEVPSYSSEMSQYNDPLIEALAEQLRQGWGLGLSPIPNMLNLVESKGIMVFSLPEKKKNTDGFSFWRNDRPFILYNPYKTAERSRFDIAHELGHLVLHGDHDPSAISSKDKEKEANLFASAFLMPKRAMIGAFPRNATVGSLISHKKKWKVSLLALNYRLYQLNQITEWTFRSNNITVNKYGRANEPEPALPEQSQIFLKVFSALKREGKTVVDIAKEFSMHPHDLSALVFDMLIHTHATPLRIIR